MPLNDDDTHTLVAIASAIAIEPTDGPPWFEAAPPRGDTIRDDFDEYRPQAGRIMHTLLVFTAEETSDRDREVDCIARALGAPPEEPRDGREDDE